jgi:lipopolysaccharide heptosyltransferase II
VRYRTVSKLTFDNILLLNLNHIGDILFTTPAIRALRETYPEARITAVVLSGLEDLLKHNPCVDQTIGRHCGMVNALRLLPKVRHPGSGMSVLFSFGSFQLAALGWLSGASTRIGFDDVGISRLLTNAVKRNPATHRVDSFLELARAGGAEPRGSKMEMFLTEDDRSKAVELMASAGVTGEKPIVALSPGSSVAAKEWYPERYAELADRLIGDGMDVLIVGSASERAAIDSVNDNAKQRIVDLAGKTGIAVLASVLERCSVVVSNDTGPMHLAVSVNTPVVAIFGPTDPRVYGPYRAESVVLWNEMSCSSCGNKTKCQHRECLQKITVDMAYGATHKLLADRKRQQ